MKVFVLLILALMIVVLSGCASTNYVTEYKVVVAPSTLYNCPAIGKLPPVATLTDLQVAKLLVNLAENNKICKSSLDKIKAYYIEAKTRIEGKS